MSKVSVGKGAAYIYIELSVSALSGYILWLLLSKITTPDVIGTASTVVSLGYIFATVMSFGIPNASPKYLGKMFSEQNFSEARLFIKASLLLICIGIAGGAAIILTLKDNLILNNLGLDLIVLCVLFMASSAIATLFRYAIISAFRTNLLALRQIFTSGMRVVLSLILVLIGTGALGLTIGYTISQIVAAILTGYIILTILKRTNGNSAINLRQSCLNLRQTCRTIWAASMPSWVPSSITAVGVQAGTIIVYGASGPSQAGIYFMAFSLFSAIITITSSLLSVAFPALSAMQDGRKRFSWRTIKISLIISLPLSSSFISYSEDILGLLAREYVKGSASLDILFLSVLPTAVMTGISTLAYAYGNYKHVLAIGLAISLPRTILYFILVPFYDGTGAALSYTIGSIAGFIVSIAISEKIGFKILWRELASILCISTAIAFSLAYLKINFAFGIPFTLIISYILLVRMQILTRLDVQDTLGILPGRISIPAIKALNIIGRKLNASY